MTPAHFPHSPWHRVVTGAISFLVILVGALSGCRTTPDEVEVQLPPVTTIRHIDVALSLVHDGPFPLLNQVYAAAAGNVGRFEADADPGDLTRSEDLARRLDTYMRRAGAPSGEELVRWAGMWNGLASLDAAYASRAGVVSRDVSTRLGSLADESAGGALLVRLLESQLLNTNAEEESIRRNLDEIYLLGDDEARAFALVGAADLIRAQGGRTGLNPVVQQAIAVVPVIESPTVALILNARLSDLSASLGNTRDTRTLQDQAVRRAEAGLLVSPEDRAAIARLLDIFIDRGDRPGAETIVENIAPVSSRAYAYAALGRSASRRDPRLPFDSYFSEAINIAFSIDDPETRAITVAEVMLIRVEGDPSWSPGSVMADLLGRVSLARFPVDVRVQVLSTLYTALILADRPQETTRLRGLIRSADELSSIQTGAAEMLIRRGAPDAARGQIIQVERIPRTPVDAFESAAFRIARVWVDLGEYDRAISVLQDADAAERARILVDIPASHRPNPAAVTDLERLLTG